MMTMHRAVRAFSALVVSVVCAFGSAQAGEGSAPALRVEILYDNRAAIQGMRADWGFSCLVRSSGRVLLFDAGADEGVLGVNLDAMNIDPGEIEAIVVSHTHGDHVGGLGRVLRADAPVPVYLPRSRPSGSSIRGLDSSARRVREFSAVEGFDGVFLTGPLGGLTVEQALVVDTPAGLVVITGCAHPGVVKMVEAAQRGLGKDVYAVLGGFHLYRTGDKAVMADIARLKGMGVKKCGACHCTGDGQMALFRKAFGEGFIELGVGAIIDFP